MWQGVVIWLQLTENSRLKRRYIILIHYKKIILSDFQAKICRNIIFMRELLVRLLTETVLQYFIFCYQIEETNIGKCRCRVCQQMLFLKASTFTDRVINHIMIFPLYFPWPSKKLQWRNRMMGSIFCYAVGLRSWDVFLQNFRKFPEQIISIETVNDCFWAF